MIKEEEIKSLSSVSDLPESLKDKILSQDEFEVISENFDPLMGSHESQDVPIKILGFQKKKFPLENNLENIVEESLQDVSDIDKDSVKMFSFCQPPSLKTLRNSKENKTSMSALHRPSPKHESLKKSGFTSNDMNEEVKLSKKKKTIKIQTNPFNDVLNKLDGIHSKPLQAKKSFICIQDKHNKDDPPKHKEDNEVYVNDEEIVNKRKSLQTRVSTNKQLSRKRKRFLTVGSNQKTD